MTTAVLTPSTTPTTPASPPKSAFNATFTLNFSDSDTFDAVNDTTEAVTGDAESEPEAVPVEPESAENAGNSAESTLSPPDTAQKNTHAPQVENAAGLSAAGQDNPNPSSLVESAAAGPVDAVAGVAAGEIVAAVSVPASAPALPRDAAIQEKWSKVWNVEKQIAAQGEVVLSQCVTVARLDKKVKDARKELKEATEDLIKLQGELVDAENALDDARSKADREWLAGRSPTAILTAGGAAQVPGLLSEAMAAAVGGLSAVGAAAGASAAGSLNPLPVATFVATSRTITDPDPALSTDLWVLKALGATNGAIEKLNGEDVRTIANLEEYMNRGFLVEGKVKGIGQSAVDKISDALMAWRKGNPVPEPREIVEIEPVGEMAVEPIGAVESVAEVAAEVTSPVPSPLVDNPSPTPAASVADGIDEQIKAAYVAGCEAAIADKPVISNPHERGTQLWASWDGGWQDTNAA